MPALILYHPSAPVVVRALELFAAARRDDTLPVVERLLNHSDAAVRAAAVRTHAAVHPTPSLLRAAAGAECPVVAATAVVALAARGWMDSSTALAELGELLEKSPAGGTGRFVARALRDHPSPALAPLLMRLANASDPATSYEAVQAMGAVRDRRYMPILIRLLASPPVRDAVRRALLALGEPALDSLRERWRTSRCRARSASICRERSRASRSSAPPTRCCAICPPSPAVWCASRFCAGWEE